MTSHSAILDAAPAVDAPRSPGVVVCETPADLETHRPAWESLTLALSEPNPFYEPWFAIPALRTFASGSNRRFLFVYGSPPHGSASAPLIGFVPLTVERLSRWMPFRVWKMWSHLYSFLHTPLLRIGHEEEALDRLFDWFQQDRTGAAFYWLETVSGEGPFARALEDVAARRRRASFRIGAYSRATFEPSLLTISGGSEPVDSSTRGAEYLANAMQARRLKDMRRKGRQLAQKGKVEERILSPQDDPGPWIEAFLALEASGWKGREKTAFADDPQHASFFRAMTRAAFAAGRLDMVGLFLDGRAIALKCNLMSGSGAFAFKIAYDESFGPQSPGVLLEAFNIERLHRQSVIRWMDSCAMPENFRLGRMWTEQRRIQHQWLATGRAASDLLVSAMPLMQWLRRKFIRIRSNTPKPTGTDDE